MCRIVGIYSLKNNASVDFSEIGHNMRDVVAYGGPDDAGDYVDEQVYLGHRRLAIIDITSNGHQPMHFDDLVITFNGEVFNYKEIASELKTLGYTFSSGSDTEVILKAFDCWSYAAVERFRGMFAFAIWNKKTKKLLLCRDRVGIKPLYWYFKNDVFLFASELKSMREYPSFDTTIDHNAVSLFLQTGYIRAPFSIYENARKLEPGSFLEIDAEGEVKKWKYWDVNNIENIPRSAVIDDNFLQQAEELISESCKLRMIADVPVGVFLSGGIDSTLVTALLQKDSSQQIKTFTIGFDDPRYNESVHAKKIADYLQTDHHEYICTESDFLKVIEKLPEMYDEPFGDSSAIPTHIVSEMARKHVTVALSADGGDEIFAGYDRYRVVADVYHKIKHLPMPVRRFVASLIKKLNPEKIHTLLTFLKVNPRGLESRLPKFANMLTADGLSEFYGKSISTIPISVLSRLHLTPCQNLFETGFSSAENSEFLLSMLGKADVASYLEGDILTKVDRATMQTALEGREPLLDHKLIEFGLSLPNNYKVRDNQSKWVLREVLYKHVPRELVDRPKQGFSIPIKQWLQTNLKDYLYQMAEDKGFITMFKFDDKVLRDIVAEFFLPDRATINPYFIWSMYSLYRWYLRWMI